MMRKLSSSVVRSTSVTCSVQVLPKIVQTGVRESSKRPDAGIVFGAAFGSAGGAESCDERVLELHIAGTLKKLGILGVGARPAAFDKSHTDRVKTLGNANFIDTRKGETFGLGSIAQCGVVDLDTHNCY